MTLLILAAGMGSRFGGLKQIEPVGPNGEFIIDYSIFDAIKAGFNKVVFIIKKENYELFKETVGNRISNRIEVAYAFQNVEDIPANIKVERIKPWGTGHAILCAQKYINDKFAIINADDFYGADCFIEMAKFLKNAQENQYAIIGYKAHNTLGSNGAGKRGIIVAKNGYVTDLIESSILKENNIITASPLNGSKSFVVAKKSFVSMNAICFTPTLFSILNTEFKKFLNSPNNDLEKDEFLIPDVVKYAIENNIVIVKLINTVAKWYGITYKSDLPEVVMAIKNYIKDGVYPQNLWK